MSELLRWTVKQIRQRPSTTSHIKKLGYFHLSNGVQLTLGPNISTCELVINEGDICLRTKVQLAGRSQHSRSCLGPVIRKPDCILMQFVLRSSRQEDGVPGVNRLSPGCRSRRGLIFENSAMTKILQVPYAPLNTMANRCGGAWSSFHGLPNELVIN